MPARLRYKVEKKVKDHHRKLKKQAKKNRDPNAKRKKPVAVIPSNVPFKEKIIQEVKEMRERETERKKLLKSVLSGQVKMDTIIRERPVVKLNSKKKPIRVKWTTPATSTATPSTSKQAEETMQCD